MRGFGRVDVNYQSRRYAEIQNLIWADPFTRINMSAGVRSKEWRLSAFVKNAANDDTSLNGFRYLDPVTFRRTAVDFLPRLRQYGVTLPTSSNSLSHPSSPNVPRQGRSSSGLGVSAHGRCSVANLQQGLTEAHHALTICPDNLYRDVSGDLAAVPTPGFGRSPTLSPRPTEES